MILIVAKSLITIGKTAPGNQNVICCSGVDCILLACYTEDKLMNDGDMDVVCIMLFLAVTTFCVYYSYTPIC